MAFDDQFVEVLGLLWREAVQAVSSRISRSGDEVAAENHLAAVVAAPREY